MAKYIILILLIIYRIEAAAELSTADYDTHIEINHSDQDQCILVQNTGQDTYTLVEHIDNSSYRAATWRGQEGSYFLKVNNDVSAIKLYPFDKDTLFHNPSVQSIPCSDQVLSEAIGLLTQAIDEKLKNYFGEQSDLNFVVQKLTQALHLISETQYLETQTIILFELATTETSLGLSSSATASSASAEPVTK